jgi:hypothetical protein
LLDVSGGVGPFIPLTVRRDTVFEYWAGSEIYELTSPDGAVYTMISYSQIIDPELQESDLPQLGGRLELPDGWSYAARTLDENLEMRAEGVTTVLSDNLECTYQLR